MDYVSYDLALALKTAGFDEPCDHYYCAFDNETDVRFWSVHPAQSQNGFRAQKDKIIADAPTLAVAQKWLREKKGIAINVIAHDGGEYHSERTILPNCMMPETRAWYVGTTTPLVDTYEQALSAGIAAALELIKKGE